jgi:uncharacterized phiE125 gp8 family phage protein
MLFGRCAPPRVAVIGPPDPILTSDEVRVRLGIEDGDDVLDPLIAAACAQIEPPLGWVGRAFGLQTLEQRGAWFADEWCGEELRLRFPPLVAVNSVKYLDDDGVEQTLDPSGYEVLGIGDAARIVLPYAGSWPSIRWAPEAVRVEYEAGYEADAPQLEPAKNAVALAVKQLLTLSTRDLYVSQVNVPGVGSRNYVLSDVAGKLLGSAVDGLLRPYRVWS